MSFLSTKMIVSKTVKPNLLYFNFPRNYYSRIKRSIFFRFHECHSHPNFSTSTNYQNDSVYQTIHKSAAHMHTCTCNAFQICPYISNRFLKCHFYLRKNSPESLPKDCLKDCQTESPLLQFSMKLIFYEAIHE